MRILQMFQGKKLFVALVLASFLIFMVAGTAMAASSTEDDKPSGLTKIKDGLKPYVDKLPADSQAGVTWVINVVLSAVVIGVVIGVLWDAHETKTARRNNSIGGQALSERKSVNRLENYLYSVGGAFVVIVVAKLFIL
jgi:hypothetical protein